MKCIISLKHSISFLLYILYFYFSKFSYNILCSYSFLSSTSSQIFPTSAHPTSCSFFLSKKKEPREQNRTKKREKIHQTLTKNTQNTVEPVLCWPTTGCAHSLRHSVVEMPSVAPLTRTDEFPSPSKVRRIIEGEVGTKS